MFHYILFQDKKNRSTANAQIFLPAGLNHLLDPLTVAVGADTVLGNV
jgi:hypothetical protein